MRIFALETDSEAIKKRFCHSGECEVLTTYYHGLSFLFAILREIIITTTLLVVLALVAFYGGPVFITIGILGPLWFIFVFFNVLRAWIDWNFDFICITTDKIILVDQSSIFRQEIKPIHLENVGGISTRTQFWGIFPFGTLTIHLKEGLGGDTILKKYIPRVENVASVISDVVTTYQRRTTHVADSPAQPAVVQT